MEKVLNRETGFANVNGTSLYYEITGSGAPVVLIHGWSFDTRCWDNQFDTFAKEYRVLRYDLRGFGKSALPKTEQSYSHTDDLIALLDHLNVEKAHVLGHSFGGRIAIDFAMSHPERIITLVLPDAAMDVQGFKPSKELIDWIVDTWEAGRAVGTDRAKEIWLAGLPFAPALRNQNVARCIKNMVEDYSGWHWENDDPYVGIEPYPPERLLEITATTLVIVGELNLLDYHMIADIQDEFIPDSVKVVLHGAGHALNIEKPEMFNEIILNFWSNLSHT